jgi:hypothetical protein
VVMDGLNAVSVGAAVAAARPDAIVQEMTALAPVHAGKPDLKHADRFFAPTIRLRTEGTDHLLAVAEATGAALRYGPCTGRGPPTTSSSWSASGCSRWSGTEPATCPRCT